MILKKSKLQIKSLKFNSTWLCIWVLEMYIKLKTFVCQISLKLHVHTHDQVNMGYAWIQNVSVDEMSIIKS
jgi:hypothetical protein